MDWLSGLGDIAVVAPASAALVVGLLLLGARRDAITFAVAMFACIVIALLAKLAFAACGLAPRFDIESPSGHAALGAAFYGSLAALLAGGRPLGVAAGALRRRRMRGGGGRLWASRVAGP